jgi:pimeloyl-ACP methyl ester carboxylesterase
MSQNTSPTRPRWRGLALKGLLLALGLCAVTASVTASIEHVLEHRDSTQFTASDTFYTTHERRIRYHLTGRNTQGPTVVLLNGLLASLEQWNGVQAALSTVSPVLSYDRGGAGFSDPAGAQDAIAEADELAQLLHSQIPGPIVLVSYSSSSFMATVFTARHPDLVKGVVFVDPAPVGLPSLPGPGRHTYRRVFWRFNLIALEAFFGYTRLRFDLSGRNAGLPPSEASKRYDAAMKSTHHWLASAHEAMSLDASVEEADAALATHPFANLPLGVLTTMDPNENTHLRAIFERQKKLAASSEQGLMRAIHCDHSELLNDPVSTGSVVDLIRTVVEEVRTGAPAGAS